MDFLRKIHVKRLILWLLLGYFVVCCVLFPLFQGKSTKVCKPVPGRNPEKQKVRERVLCIDDNQDALIRRLQVIESAKEELVLTTFHYSSDESGKDIMAALYHAASRGVRIRMVVDGVCAFTDLNGSPHFQALANHDNVEIRVYNPVNVLKAWTFNYRMHDKYVIADRNVYLLGGRNTKNVSLGAYQEKHDNDRDVLVWNPLGEACGSLGQVLDYFEAIWESPIVRPYRNSDLSRPKAAEELENRYLELRTLYPEAYAPVDFEAITVQTDGVTLYTNPITIGNKEPTLWASLCCMMEQGKDVLIQTPYIVCSRDMYRDLAKIGEKTEQFRIVTNAPESGANPCGVADLMNQKHRVVRTGATVYEHAGLHSSHAKTVLIDDRMSIIGSFNCDMRSTYLDTEMMLAIDCPELNAELRAKNDTYIAASRITAPDGTVSQGPEFAPPPYSVGKRIFYGVLRIIILPLRQLL